MKANTIKYLKTKYCILQGSELFTSTQISEKCGVEIKIVSNKVKMMIDDGYISDTGEVIRGIGNPHIYKIKQYQHIRLYDLAEMCINDVIKSDKFSINDISECIGCGGEDIRYLMGKLFRDGKISRHGKQNGYWAYRRNRNLIPGSIKKNTRSIENLYMTSEEFKEQNWFKFAFGGVNYDELMG